MHLIAERLDRDREAVDARLRRLAGLGFPLLRRCFYPQSEAATLVGALAARGMRQIVATNPLWPLDTVLARLAWGRIDTARVRVHRQRGVDESVQAAGRLLPPDCSTC